MHGKPVFNAAKQTCPTFPDFVYVTAPFLQKPLMRVGRVYSRAPSGTMMWAYGVFLNMT